MFLLAPIFTQFAIDWVAGNDAVNTGGSQFTADLTVTSTYTQRHRITDRIRSADASCREFQQQRRRDSRWRLTSLLGGLVVGLADQPAVLHQVVLVTCGQLPLAHDAGKAVQVIDEVLRSPHHLCGRDPLLTGRTFCPESPFGKLDGWH